MTPLELVDQTSEGTVMSPSDLEVFLLEHPKEGQHLDYKSGLLFLDAQASAKLRRHVSGMANAAGGVLIIGVRDDRTIDGFSAKGGKGAKAWAENCVAPLAAHFTTPPHFLEVDHSNGCVLIAAIHRNGRLIPVIDAGRTRYYLRLGEQTMEAPDFHVADLLLGRRELPVIELRAVRGQCPLERGSGFNFSLELDLFNEGSIWVEEVQVGLIGLNVFSDGQPKDKLPNSMRANLNMTLPTKTWVPSERIGLHYHSEHFGRLPPLDGHQGIRLGPLKIDVNMLQGRILYLKAAVFCVPRQGTIQWFQLTCGIALTDHGHTVTVSPLRLLPKSGGDHVDVAWHLIAIPENPLTMTIDHDWEAML